MKRTQKVTVKLRKSLRTVKCHLRGGKLYTHRSNTLIDSDAILHVHLGW